MSSRTLFKYTRAPGYDPYLCAYCGDDARALDHVVPVSSGLRSDGNMYVVPVCTKCNGKLGARWLPTILARTEFMVNDLDVKVKKAKKKQWTEAEMEDLGPNLKAKVLKGIRAYDHLVARLAYARFQLRNLLSLAQSEDRSASR
jgi:hypothetical protein